MRKERRPLEDRRPKRPSSTARGIGGNYALDAWVVELCVGRFDRVVFSSGPNFRVKTKETGARNGVNQLPRVGNYTTDRHADPQAHAPSNCIIKQLGQNMSQVG